ncbi:hypothetical protein SH449x_000795 [Pirellulaceae bacterium SH449]
MMDFEFEKSGRHSIHSATISTCEESKIESELEEFWSKVAMCFQAETVDHLRVELWADSGRLICFGVGEAGEQRVGECTVQVTINQFAQDWLQVEEASDDEFDIKAEQLNRRYIALSEQARSKRSLSTNVRYFDADSEDSVT